MAKSLQILLNKVHELERSGKLSREERVRFGKTAKRLEHSLSIKDYREVKNVINDLGHILAEILNESE